MFVYPKGSVKILEAVDLVIHQGDSVGFVGLNGAGKSTLSKLTLGETVSGGLQPTHGKIERSSRARIAHFSQHCVEGLEYRAQICLGLTALRDIIDASDGALTEKEARSMLGAVGLSSSVVSNVHVGSLSGGQKVRLALLRLLCPIHLIFWY